MRLTLKQLAFKIADGLPKLCDDRSVRSSLNAYVFDVWTDQGLLADPVVAHDPEALNVTGVHAVCPRDIIGKG